MVITQDGAKHCSCKTFFILLSIFRTYLHASLLNKDGIRFVGADVILLINMHF